MSSTSNEIPKSYPGRHGDVYHHSTNLFDLDERANDGALVDEATGLPYDNSTQTDEQFFQEGGARIGHIVDLADLEAEGRERDAADAWLAAHDRPDSRHGQPADTAGE